MSKKKDIKSKDLFISFKHTLEQYNKKYRNRPDKLVKLTTKEVEDFDKKYGHYTVNKKTYSLEFEHYLLKGFKWWYIEENDTYYQIPRAPRYLWFRNLKTSTQILTGVLTVSTIAAAIIVPYYIILNGNTISTKIEDLLPQDKEQRAYILERVDVSNTRVILGQDFNTVISIKDEKKPDYNIADIKVFTYKDNPSANSTRVELVKDQDYTFTNELEKATLKVFSKSFNSKIEIDVKLNGFKDYVTFEDKTIGYNRNEFEFGIEFKQGKSSLPSGTSVTYTYNQQSQSEKFKFTNVGTYPVNVTLKCNGFKDYSKTATLKIERSEYPYKNEIGFDTTKLSCKETDKTTVPDVNKGGHGEDLIDDFTPSIEYKVNNEWTTTRPTVFGVYPIRCELKFKNYIDYYIENTFTINEVGKIQIEFDVNSNGGSWEDGSTISKKSQTIKVSLQQKHFSDFKNSIEGYKDPIKKGYSFSGWEGANGTKYTDTTEIPMNLEESFTVKATFTANTYTITNSTTEEEKAKFSELTFPASPITYDTSVDIIAKGIPGCIPDYIKINNNTYNFVKNGDSYKATFTMEYPNDINVYCYTKYEEYSISTGTHSAGVKSVDISKTTQCTIADTIKVTCENEAGYKLNKVEITGDFIKITKSFTEGINYIEFTMPAGNATVTVYAHALSYTATFNKNGGSIKKNGTEVSSLDIKTDELVLTKLSGYTATHAIADFDYWEMTKQDGTSIQITSATKMPAGIVTIKPVWKTYDVHIMLNGVEQTSEKLTNVLIVYSDDFNVTIPSGQVISKYQYKFGSEGTYSDLDGMPFKPHEKQTTYNKDVYLNIITVDAPEVIEVFLDAGEGGKFEDGNTDQKVLSIYKGDTLSNVLAITGTPKKNGNTPTKWVDDNGSEVTLNQAINDNIIVHAVYGGSY